MNKSLFFIGFSLFCGSMFAQENVDYYEVNELHLTDLTKLTTNENFDFGYNYTKDIEKGIMPGYYIWIDDSWYNITNVNQIFNVDQKSPLFFTIKKDNLVSLHIKDTSGVEYAYPIESIEGYKISSLIYNTNIEIIENVDEIETQQKKVVSDEIKSNPIENVINDIVVVSETLSDKAASIFTNSTGTSQANEVDSEVVLATTKTEEFTTVDLTNVETTLEESEDGTVVLPEGISVVEMKSEQVSTEVTEVLTAENLVPVLSEVDTEVKAEQILSEVGTEVKAEQVSSEIVTNETASITTIEEPKNAYEKAVANGFDGTVTEWIESINALGGETAFEMAVKDGFDGTEEEWMRSLWGSNVAPEIEKQNKVAGIVAQWISQLGTKPGNTPYDLALKNGFYGTYTEWIESVVGQDGEVEYENEKKNGFTGSFKEWIESKLKASNAELLRKEKLRKNNFVIVPNLQLVLTEKADDVLEFDLFDYYNKYFGVSMVSSSKSNANDVKLLNTDLEYQITWYDVEKIEIIEISANGIVKYKSKNTTEPLFTSINVRYLLP